MGNKKPPYNEDQMSIAPGYTVADWKKLDLDSENSSDWREAIKIFNARIRGRYLDPVDKLIALDKKRANEKDRRFGFTILAIDCLLIETLQAFIEGVGNTWKLSKKMFVNFLTERPSFSVYFDEKSACRFYYDVRCGILHQAETRFGWRVLSVGPLLDPKGNKIRIINRTEFHEALKSEFDSYVTKLRDLKDTKQDELREKFRNQMDGIVKGS